MTNLNSNKLQLNKLNTTSGLPKLNEFSVSSSGPKPSVFGSLSCSQSTKPTTFVNVGGPRGTNIATNGKVKINIFNNSPAGRPPKPMGNVNYNGRIYNVPTPYHNASIFGGCGCNTLTADPLLGGSLYGNSLGGFGATQFSFSQKMTGWDKAERMINMMGGPQNVIGMLGNMFTGLGGLFGFGGNNQITRGAAGINPYAANQMMQQYNGGVQQGFNGVQPGAPGTGSQVTTDTGSTGSTGYTSSTGGASPAPQTQTPAASGTPVTSIKEIAPRASYTDKDKKCTATPNLTTYANTKTEEVTQKMIDDAEADVTSLEAYAADLGLQVDIDRIQNDIEKYDAEISKDETEATQEESAYKAADSKVKSYEEDISKVETDITKKDNDINTKKNELSKLKEPKEDDFKNDDGTLNNEAYQAALKEYKDKKAELEKEINKLEEEKAQLNKQMDEYKDGLSKAVDERQKAADALAAKKQKVADLIQQRETAKNELRELKSRQQQLQREAQNKRSELEQLKKDKPVPQEQ